MIEIGAGEAEVAREMTGVVDRLGKLEGKVVKIKSSIHCINISKTINQNLVI